MNKFENKDKINKPEKINTEEVLNQLAHRYRKEGEENKKVKKEYHIIDHKGKKIKSFWQKEQREEWLANWNMRIHNQLIEIVKNSSKDDNDLDLVGV